MFSALRRLCTNVAVHQSSVVRRSITSRPLHTIQGSLTVPMESIMVMEHNHMHMQTVVIEEAGKLPEEIFVDSVMRKRKLKMKKHKLRKRRKNQKAERRKQSQGK